MNKNWKYILIAAGALAAAAFYVHSGELKALTEDQVTFLSGEEELKKSDTEVENGSREKNGTDGIENTQETTEEEAGFTEKQKQELEELLESCLKRELAESVEEAVETSLSENLKTMMEDGRLAGSVAKYTEVQSSLVNINTADAEQLKRLTGIGDAKAQAILSYRAEHGGFQTVEELTNVSGISSGILEKLRSQVTL